MKTHKSILVSCHIKHSPQAIPLAVSLLKSYTKDKENIDVDNLDFYSDDSPLDSATKIVSMNPDSVGFSMYIWNRDFFEEVASVIKNKNPDIIIYSGGAEVTASWESLSFNDHFEYLIRGEGEIPFSRLMDYLSGKSKISVQKIVKQDHLQNLNVIPSPFLEGILKPGDWDGILWELSRGCPFNCSFCSESRGISGVRYFDEERIIKELQFFEENNVEQIFVLDPTFNIKIERAIKILSLIKEHAPYIHYTFEIRAELLTEELALAFADTHCSLQIGLQSAHHEVLKKLNRNIDRDQFQSKISLLNQCGAVFGLDLIYGLPGDSKDGFLESLDYALYCIPNHLDIFRLSVFPGTELYDKSSELQLKFQNKPPYHVLNTPEFSSDDLAVSEGIAAAVDLFYNKGRSAPWLLSVTEYLKLTPSAFFIKFTDFLNDNEYSESKIFDSQASFLISLFSNDKHDGLACSIDMALFHNLYSEVLLGMPIIQENSTDTVNIYDSVYTLNSTIKYGIFSFDVTLYSELGMLDINDFLLQYSPQVSYGLIFNNGLEISTMEVEKYLYEFILNLDGKKTIDQILVLINKKAEEMKDFIGFLVESELIIRAV